MNNPPERPDCIHCTHYFVTWEADKPRGCHAYEFKSTELPSDVVLEASDAPCQFFERRLERSGRTKLLR